MARPAETTSQAEKAFPGTVKAIRGEALVVQSRDSEILLERVQPPNKGSMNAVAWFRGQNMAFGAKLS
jgi:methionyl-tRNA formyltransferase